MAMKLPKRANRSPSSGSPYATPPYKAKSIHSQERLERLFKEGILSSPSSPVATATTTSSTSRKKTNPALAARTRVSTTNQTTSSSSSSSTSSTTAAAKGNSNNQDITTSHRSNNHNANKKQSKTVVFHLIRHGQSLGQTVSDPHRRCSDGRLLDCGLSNIGIEQAKNIVLPDTVQLLVSSPLTRSVATACLANHYHAHRRWPILIHYHLRELGSMIPENIPRRPKAVQDDLERTYGIHVCNTSCTSSSTRTCDGNDADMDPHCPIRIDWDTLMPEDWPRRHDESPKLIRRDRVRDALYYLATQRPETEMAIFCHYHVIQAAVQVRADNAMIITCEMCTATGELRLLLLNHHSPMMKNHKLTSPTNLHTGTVRRRNGDDDDEMDTD